MWLLNIINKSPLDDIQKIVEKTINAAKENWNAVFDGEYPKGGIGISTLRPFHVQDGTTYPDTTVNNWRTTIDAAETWEDWINLTTGRNLYIICTGMFDRTLSPALLETWFKADGRDSAVQNIEEVFTWDAGPTWYWSKPFMIPPEKGFQAQLYGKVAQVEIMGLKGFCIAKTSVLIDQS